MLRRTRQAQTAFILTSLEVEVIHAGVRVSVCSVEADALQGRGYETEIALIGYLHTQQVGVTRVTRLAELGIRGAVVIVVAHSLVYDEIIDFLVEDTGTDKTDALEVILTAQVEVIRNGGFQARITQRDGVVATLNRNIRCQGRILRSCNCIGERGTHLEVIVYIILHKNGRKHIQITVRLVGCAGGLVFVRIILATRIFHMCILQTQAQHQVPLLTQFLVETQITCRNGFFGVEVGGKLFLHLVLFKQTRIVQVKFSQILLAYEATGFILLARHVSVPVLVYGSRQTGFVETVFIQRGVFVEINLFIFSLMHHLGSEAQMIAELSFCERQAEIELELEVLLLNIFLLLRHLFQAEIVVQIHSRTFLRSKQRLALIAQIHSELLFLQLIVDVAFVGTFFAGFGVVYAPLRVQFAEEVLAAEGEVHCALTFQTGIAVVGRAAFGLHAHGAFVVDGTIFVAVVVFFQVDTFHVEAVTVFPVVAVVEDAFESQLVVFVDVPVQCGGVALSFAGDVVLAHLIVGDTEFSGFYILVPYKFDVIRAGGGVLIGSGKNESQFVVEEAVAIGETQVQLRFVTNPVVARSGGGTDEAFIRRVLCNQIDGTADGVGIHIRGDYFVHFDGLYHICRDEVQLHVARIAFGRRDAVAVDSDGTHVGGGAAHLSEAGFTLVVLYVDT